MERQENVKYELSRLRDQESKRYRRKARIEIPTGGLTDEMSTEEDGRKNKKLFFQAPGSRTTGKQAGKKHMEKKTIFIFVMPMQYKLYCTGRKE